MNAKNESKLKMLLALRILLRTNEALTVNLPNFSKFLNDLDLAIGNIQSLSGDLAVDSTGIAGGKKQQREELQTAIEDAANRIQAYARFVNNPALLVETRFSGNKLNRASDLELIDIGKVLARDISANINDVAPYGLTAETIKTLDDLIAGYEAAIPQTRQTQVDRKGMTQQLNQAFENAYDAVDNIDMLMEILKFSEPAFYASYKATRKVIATGNGSLAVQGTVTDATTQQPLTGAQLTFRLHGEEEIALIKQTADKGGFKIKSLNEGIYTVDVSKTGYHSQNLSLTVDAAQLAELEVKLVKVLS